MVAKMNFPISSLPSVAIAANLFSYFVMMAIYVIVLLAFGIYPNLQWLEYIYYLFCMIVFMFAFSLFNSTISVLHFHAPIVIISFDALIINKDCGINMKTLWEIVKEKG